MAVTPILSEQQSSTMSVDAATNTETQKTNLPQPRRRVLLPQTRHRSVSSSSNDSSTSSESLIDNSDSCASNSNGSNGSSVSFSDEIKTHTIPSLDCYSEKERKATYMTEQDYERSNRNINLTLRAMAKNARKESRDEDDKDNLHQEECCFLGMDFATPLGQQIRYNLRQHANDVVHLEQQYQRQKGNETLNEDIIAAVYQPVSMQAQFFAYERAVLNAMELD